MLLVSSYIGFILLSVQLTKCDISDIIHGEDEPDDITVEPRLDGQHNSNGISLNDALPGTAGIDYPIFSSPPRTHFTCQNRHFGYYADIEAKCQVFRVCANTDITGSGFAFLCPNGTLFNQQFFVCDWYSNVYCPGSEKYFVLNEEFGKRVTPDKLLANAKAMAVLPKLFESTQTFVSSIMHAPRNLTGIGFSEDSSSSLETSVGTSTRKPPTIQLQVETGGTFTETKEQIRKPIYSGSGIIGSYIDRQKIPRIKQTFSGDASGVETNSEGVGVEVEDSTADPLQKESIRPIITNQIEQIPGYTYDLPPSYQTYSLGTSQSFDAINQYYPVASPKNQYLPSLPSQEYLPTQKYLPTIPTQKYLPSLPSQQYLPSVPSNKYLPTPVDARTSGKYYSPSASSVQDSGVQYAIRNEYIPPKGQLPLLKPKINAAENYFNRNDDSNEDTNSDDGSFYGNFGKQVYTYPLNERYPSSNEPIAYYPQEQQQYVNNNNYQTSYGSDDISYKNRYPVAGQYASSIPSILPSVVHSSSATGRQNYNSLHDNVIVKVVPSLNWYLNDANERRSYFNAVSRGLLNENGYFYVNNVRGNNQRQHYNTSPYNKNFISNLYSDNNGFSSYRGPFSGVENYSYRR